ncbi:MAG TPA: sigma 54-interacting transcriptional regulator [Syntrophales bacterium]|nr:sigma 54-interacting transcriptional regulator [Syntrophales bacterium]
MQTIDQLKRWKLIYDRILDMSADGFLVVDSAGYIIDINPAYCTFLGRKKSDIVGKYVTDIIRNSKLPHFLKTGESEVNVIHRLAKGQTPGGESYVAVTRAAVKDGERIVAAVGQIYFAKEIMELTNKLQAMDMELDYYKKELNRLAGEKYSFANMIGRSKIFLDVKKIAERAARNEFAVLILGETGTGKEVFAHAIHYASKRRFKPLIRVNCAAIPSELLESELFGYEDGAFTGARRGGKRGKFELAHGGTIFLDEIGEMPKSMQVKLLRVLQEKEYERVGGTRLHPLDVRIIAATNKKLQPFQPGDLREDLYYRLSAIQFTIPPLRERREDIPLFVNAILRRLNDNYGRRVVPAPEVFDLLVSYSWPGNVRELINAIESAYSIVEGDAILSTHLPSHIRNFISRKPANQPHKSQRLSNTIDAIEKDILLAALKRNNFNCKAVARELGIHRSTLYRKFEKYKLGRQSEWHFTL